MNDRRRREFAPRVTTSRDYWDKTCYLTTPAEAAMAQMNNRHVLAERERTIARHEKAAHDRGVQGDCQHPDGFRLKRGEAPKLKRLVAAGLSTREIAERMKRGMAWVQGIRSRMGIPGPRYGRRLTKGRSKA